MKNITKTLAIAYFLLFAVWSHGQSLSSTYSYPQHPVLNQPVFAQHSSNTTDRTAAAGDPTHMVMKYWESDQVNQGAAPNNWVLYGLYQNAYFNINDTGANSNKNVYTLNSVTVAFDTITDTNGHLYTMRFDPNKQVTIDTIFAAIDWKNFSGANDTLIFRIIPVYPSGIDSIPAGYPNYSAAPYGSDTLILWGQASKRNNYGFKLPGLNWDSVYYIALPLKSPLAIPVTAYGGHSFAIQASFYGSKSDTMGICDEQYIDVCPSNVAFTPIANYSTVGIPISWFGGFDGVLKSGVPSANSFDIGNYLFTTIKDSGSHNGVPLSWPDVKFGLTFNGKYIFFQFPCEDTATSLYQNYMIGVSINSADFNPMGINEVSGNGNFSINQNFPNPFSDNTEISYNLTQSSDVVFRVYDLAGRELVNNAYSTVAPGKHAITLQAKQFTPGIYFYTFNIGGTQVTKKMVITQ